MKLRAILSVSDKTGITELAAALRARGYELVSTGGTAKILTESGLPVTQVEDVTGFPECLDGRVKTLHPGIFAGLLAVRGNAAHEKTLTDFSINFVDVVVSNLYPFRETVLKENCLLEEAIENIDIGGPSMIRAAAKNHASVAVLTEPGQYNEFIERLNNDTIDGDYRFALAVKAFNHTAAYDAYIAEYLNSVSGVDYPERLTLTYRLSSAMRYGENPHQSAAYYTSAAAFGLESARFLHGKELSYNNIGDAQAAVALIKEFDEPACAAIKHATPCGVAIGADICEAFTKARDADPVSIFGGIIAFNREVDCETAERMKQIFLEVIVAPSYSREALDVLRAKKNLRLLELPGISQKPANIFEIKSAGGGLLIQSADNTDIAVEGQKTVTSAAPTDAQTRDLIFAMKVARHVRSNAIVVAKAGRTLGVGGGQVSRVWAAEQAVARAKALKEVNGAVLASDALLPFPDVAELCGKAGIAAIIQPGGSKNDRLSIDVCDKYGIAMVFTGVRHFKH